MKIYFSGIGGVGIGPLAQIAHYAGYNVTGSDQNSSLITKELDGLNVSFDIGLQTGDFLDKSHQNQAIDWFVFTSALPVNHPELLKAKELGIKTAKRDELLSKIIKDKKLKLIAIAGTHGKTSTTALAVWLFKKLGIPASYSIGSTVNFAPSGFYDSNSQYFIYECDEFDRNFLHFHPYLSVITSLDYDHPDTYPTKSSYQEAFKEFVSQSTYKVAWDHQPANVYEGQNNVTLVNSINPDITLPGEHIRANATLLINGLQQIDVINKENYSHAIDAINSFPGTDRRFEMLANNLYSDYGHHPVEIEKTLQMAKEVANKEGSDVVLVYQPHQNIRQHNIKDAYKDQFLLADKIYWLPTFLSREDPSLPILSPQELSKNIINKQSIYFSDLDDKLWQDIKNHLKNNNLVIGMGAGNIDSWLRQKSAEL